MTVRIDIVRKFLHAGTPAIRVTEGPVVRYARRAEFAGGRVIQDGTIVYLEVDGAVTVDGASASVQPSES